MQLYALFRLAFASAPNLQFLTSLHNATRRSVLQKVQDHTLIVLSLLVSTGFQVLFHSPPGVLFTFPSRYYALSVTGSYLALEGGPPLVSCGTLVSARCLCLSITGPLPSLEVLSNTLHLDINMHFADPQPRPTVVRRFGLLRVRSPLLAESRLFSLPPGT